MRAFNHDQGIPYTLPPLWLLITNDLPNLSIWQSRLILASLFPQLLRFNLFHSSILLMLHDLILVSHCLQLRSLIYRSNDYCVSLLHFLHPSLDFRFMSFLQCSFAILIFFRVLVLRYYIFLLKSLSKLDSMYSLPTFAPKLYFDPSIRFNDTILHPHFFYILPKLHLHTYTM